MQWLCRYKCEHFWSIGVLECWQKQKPEFNLNWFLHYSITPPDWRKGERVWKPPQGAVQSRACRAVAMAKAGPLGPDSLLFWSLNIGI
jgi:hypothetical protein